MEPVMGAKDRGIVPEPEPFGIESSRHDGRWVVAVRGELDLATVGTLDEELGSLAPPILLDLSRVSFMDSMGVHLLMRRTKDGLTLGATSPEVTRLLQTCGLENELRYTD
jgi:anti-anti-sigma factor